MCLRGRAKGGGVGVLTVCMAAPWARAMSAAFAYNDANVLVHAASPVAALGARPGDCAWDLATWGTWAQGRGGRSSCSAAQLLWLEPPRGMQGA